ncbi:MAG: pseudouridylate synthase [Muribaculaceae bacterium]|nr:pseudouridylate synthase [Muribaculaceae bacterium]
MKLDEIDILELLPQRPPFVMIDRLVEYDETTTVTEFEVRADNIFIDSATGMLRREALIENIAQTCAARLGYYFKYILKQPVRVGVIGALRHCRFNTTAKVGDLLTTKITVREEIFGMTLIDGEVKCGDTVLASTEMKIALPPQQ